MLLNDKEIAAAIRTGEIDMRPPLQDQDLRPTGIRVHLAQRVLIPQPGQVVDLQTPSDLQYRQINLHDNPLTLAPGDFVLSSTTESVRIAPHLLITLEGRSTIARLGLTIHNTSSVLDGTPNEWFSPVLEIANHGSFSVILRPGTPIAMLCFQRLKAPCSRERYHPQYQGQTEVRPANLLEDASAHGLQVVRS